jgi:hypothetical protein
LDSRLWFVPEQLQTPGIEPRVPGHSTSSLVAILNELSTYLVEDFEIVSEFSKSRPFDLEDSETKHTEDLYKQ